MTPDDRELSRRAFHARAALLAGLGLTAPRRGLAQGSGKTAKPGPTGVGAPLGTRRVFSPADPWNTPVASAPVDRNSARILRRLGLNKPLHPDFGTVYNGAPNGIPYVVVPGNQPKVPVTFTYADESDPGPYPIPPDAPIEGGPNGEGDRHVLVVDRDNWKLYELFNARKNPDGNGWSASSGAVFDLTTNTFRPAGWTSADAAGLPIFPGLVRYEEVVSHGVVRHAFRFTVVKTRRAYVAPARHFASRDTGDDLLPMGARVRLKASYDVRRFPPQARVILQTLQNYGMLVADNGGDWFLGGAPDPRWDDEQLATLKNVKVADFEVVRMGPLFTR
ncbi:MAG: hypothetical protein U0835_10015 [Isosphaeraceae bacterium]